jgi:TolB protein
MSSNFKGVVQGAALALVAVIVAQAPARGELKVDITQGSVEPLPIAVTDFYGATPEDGQSGRDIAGVIAGDLERSGLFRPIDQGAFIQDVISLRSGPRFGDWRLINTQALVQGGIEMQSDGRLRVEFRLWDVFAEQQMTGLAYFGPQNRRVKRLAIMDQDGANHRFLTDGNELVLTPRFSPTTQEITYMSYLSNTPRVYLFNLNTGQQEVLGDFPGMTFSPRFTPDGNQVVMFFNDTATTEIYTLDLRTRATTRLTNHPAIDTSPSFSPDGQRIAFNSDRGGTQQLYVMNADGSNVHRISFNKGRYATPVWSPRGDLIAFTRILQGEFYIGVMHPDGSGERMLTKGFLVEAPTWAPNGRVLSYFRQSRADARGRFTSKIYTIDLTGFNEREVVTPIDASDPAWSPLIP